MTAPLTPVASPSASALRTALAWTHTARFLTTAARLDQLPTSLLPEIAFVGRSNAGKSTAINTLAQQRRLAFASKTPGRTQHINLFSVGPKDAPEALFADLPGYGYAAVERQAKLRWQQVMADYLAQRRNLAGVVLLVDPRLGLTDLDHRLLDFVRPRIAVGEVKLMVVLTKTDKLNRAESSRALAVAQAALADYVTEDADVGLLLFSALKRVGVEDLADSLRSWADESRSRWAAAVAGAPEATAEGAAEAEGAAPAPEEAAPAPLPGADLDPDAAPAAGESPPAA